MGAVLGSPLTDPLGDGAAVPSLPGARVAAQDGDGDGVGEVAAPSPESAPEEPEEPGEFLASEEPGEPDGPDGPDDVVWPVTALPTVVPAPPPKVLPETSSQAVMPAMVTVNTRAAATSGRRRVRSRAR